MDRAEVRQHVERTDEWFLDNGLPYFVPAGRVVAGRALNRRRIVPVAIVIVALAVGAAVWLSELTGRRSTGLIVLLSLAGLLVGWYALAALHSGSIIWWALRRTFDSLWELLPLMSRALPMLLLFMTFLFINAEVWQVAASLDGEHLWWVTVLFTGLAAGFLLVRLPEEVRRVDDGHGEEEVAAACAETPLAPLCEGDGRAALMERVRATRSDLSAYERWNLILVLFVIQAVQVALLALTVFGFFVLLGVTVMSIETQQAWTQMDDVRSFPGLENLSPALLQVSAFLSAFAALYLTVSTVTDQTYREQFFGRVTHQLERAIGVRAVYCALLDAAAPAEADAD